MAPGSLLWDTAASSFGIFAGRLLTEIHVPPTDLTGKTAVVTGANSGIGYSLALSLAKRNATVYLACRNTTKGEAAVKEIVKQASESSLQRVHLLELDTSSLKSVRDFAQTLLSSTQTGIDILVHNAGISGAPQGQEITGEGLGTIYATNFLGSFLLTSLLEKHLSNNARVIFTTSTGQYAGNLKRLFEMPRMAPQATGRKLPDSALYSDTKAFQVAFARLLQERFDSTYPEKHLVSHSFSPGYTQTAIFDKTTSTASTDPAFWALKAATAIALPLEQGAATGLWLATTDDEKVVSEGKGGAFWDRCVRRTTAVDSMSRPDLDRLWRVWEEDSGAKWS
ncbi:hypothetical protein B9Z65_1240 [Elsinoe australis]|uniref:NAD(P)-binding protein n=1 Tax=Elsinoe australis TaxID=40998 RepID=A0A2P7YQ25_9PEZI|nr:hypothetical protein B9Z65_1240 [Elsinoe australis]